MWVTGSASNVPLTREHTKACLTKDHRNITKWLWHCLHGLGGVPPPTGCRASGENKKKPMGKFTFHRLPDALHPGKTGITPEEKACFLSRRFLVFSAPVGLVSVVSFDAVCLQNRFLYSFRFLPSFPLPGGNAFVLPYNRFACWVQGGTPCRGVQGLRKPLLRFSATGGNCLSINRIPTPTGSRGETPGLVFHVKHSDF